MNTYTRTTMRLSMMFLYITATLCTDPDMDDCPTGCDCYDSLRVRCDNKHLSHIPISNNLQNTFTEISLSRNFFPELPSEAFSTLKRLKKIVINKSQVIEIDLFAFSGLTYLEDIRLEDNELVNIGGGIFDSNPSLKIISLRKNPLNLTSSNPFPDSLTFLDLSRCYLEYLSSDVLSGLTQLETLILTHNSLESLPVGFFDNLHKLKKVYLHGNPWRCNGDLEQLMISKQDIIADYKKIRLCVTSDGEEREWSPWRTTQRIASTGPWIQEALETNPREAVDWSRTETSSDNLDDVGKVVESAAVDDAGNVVDMSAAAKGGKVTRGRNEKGASNHGSYSLFPYFFFVASVCFISIVSLIVYTYKKLRQRSNDEEHPYQNI